MERKEELRVRFALNEHEDPLLHFIFTKTDSKDRGKLVRSMLRRLAVHQLGITASDLPERLRFLYSTPPTLELSQNSDARAQIHSALPSAAPKYEVVERNSGAEITAGAAENILGTPPTEDSNVANVLVEEGEFDLPPFILKGGLGVLAEGANY